MKKSLIVLCVVAILAAWSSCAKKIEVKEREIGGMKFVWIPAGTYTMGSPEKEEYLADARPQHEVTVDGFWMGKYEVTQKQYHEVLGAKPSLFKGDSNPVETVSWGDAVNFCKRFGTKNKVTARLPTEAEWEYACRAGTTTGFYWGNDYNDAKDYAWYGNHFSERKTYPVGQKKANAYGLHDIIGNVMEWCLDWYAVDYYKNSPKQNPQGPFVGTQRVIRGSSWKGGGGSSYWRYKIVPTFRTEDIGFRVVVAGP